MAVAAPELLGRQEPTIKSVPPSVSTSGPEVVEMATKAGLILDPWQELILRDAMGERPDGKWSAFESAVIVGRQNGKSAIFEARMLAGLFLLDEELVIYSAHEFKTAQEIFRRMEQMITGSPKFSRRVKAVSRSKGDEGIELTTGQRLRFVARSTGSGRGFSGDCNIWDECQNLGDGPVDALMPTMSARPNPQLWYGGSAPDKELAPCEQIARVRTRAKAGGPSLAYFEWSAELCNERCPEGCDEHDDPADPEVWAKTNPGLGIRIQRERIEREHDSMSAKGFARERLSVGNWPTSDDAKWSVISEAAWTPLAEVEALPVDPVALAVHVASDRRTAAVAAAWRRADGFLHVEVVRHNPGTGWVVEDVLGMVGRNVPCALVLDPGSQTGSLIPELEAGLAKLKRVELEITKTTMRQVTQAVGQFYDAVMPTDGEPALRYTEYTGLTLAVAGADKRTLGDAWAWDRKNATVDLAPLEVATLAAWGFVSRPVEQKPPPAGPSKQTLDKFGGNELFRPTSRLAI